MAQQPHVTTPGDGSAIDITAGLPAGCYVAQNRGGNTFAVLYATADAPPADLADYFRCEAGEAFEFYAGSDAMPTWVRGEPWLDIPTVNTIAIAQVGS